jgi:hypothetical protein
MSTSPDRQSFRQLVSEVAARAKAILPHAVNGRVESAARLVLLHDVTPQKDGSILVGSSTDPMKTYRLEGSTCTCQDFVHGQAPEGWCQHRVAANIDRRVRELLPVEPVEPLLEPWPDNDPEPEAEPPPCPVEPVPPTPAPLPEAAFSMTLKGTMGGVDAMITVRGMTADEFRRNLAAVKGLLDVPQSPAQASSTGQLSPHQYNALAMHRPVTGVCKVHQVTMQWNEGKDGRKGWYSHRTPEGHWCKGT